VIAELEAERRGWSSYKTLQIAGSMVVSAGGLDLRLDAFLKCFRQVGLAIALLRF
jgi:hypothetical protein